MERTWSDGDQLVRALLRPDGLWLLKLPDKPSSWGALVQARPAGVDPLLVITSTEGWRQPLQDLGFRAVHTEQVWRIPVRAVTHPPVQSENHDLVPVLGCDLARVVELDNTVRHQIPGTQGWAGSLADLRDELADDEFDPQLYLIAVHRTTGSYDGLVRIWNRHPRPRLGCVGVRPQWRRTRLAPALLSSVAATLRHRGVSEILTETDLANRDSYPMAARWGIPQERVVQWVRDSD